MKTVNLIQSLNGTLFDDFPGDKSNGRHPLPYGNDCLARAAANHAHWKSSQGLYRFTDLGIIQVTDKDHEHADRIRKYYCDQLMMKKLRGGELTNFQHDLWGLLSGHDRPEMRHVGMLYQVPFFYDEDRSRDHLHQEFRYTSFQESQKIMVRKGLEVLTPHARIFVTRRGTNRHEYWFVNQQDQPAMLSIQDTNPLRGLIHSLHQHGEKIKIMANKKVVQDRFRPGFEYIALATPEFAVGDED